VSTGHVNRHRGRTDAPRATFQPGEKHAQFILEGEQGSKMISKSVPLGRLGTPRSRRPGVSRFADGLHERLRLRREEVSINLVEVKKEGWSF
jgi:hypothetical protein